jgi:hypothetical protein
VDSLICGVVATLATTLVLSSIYYSSMKPGSFGDAFVSFRGELISATTDSPLVNPDTVVLAVGAVLAVLAVVLSTLSRRRAGRSRKASAGRWLGVGNLIAYGACAAVLALLPLENHIVFDSPEETQSWSSWVDSRLAADLQRMAVKQDKYVTAHPDKRGVAVAATTPGGTATVMTPNDFFRSSPGNVIAVKVGPSGVLRVRLQQGSVRGHLPARINAAPLWERQHRGHSRDLLDVRPRLARPLRTFEAQPRQASTTRRY